MNRKDFLATFAASPLAFISAEQLQQLQREDSAAFIFHVDGRTYGLAFRFSDFPGEPLRGFEYLKRSAEGAFIEKVVFRIEEV